MKRIILAAAIATIAALGLSGCTGVVTQHKYTQEEINKAYEVGQVSYKVTKEIVKVVAPKIDAETMSTLIAVDKVATGVDGIIDPKKPLHVDINSTVTE